MMQVYILYPRKRGPLQATAILFAKVWRQKLDYAKNLQANTVVDTQCHVLHSQQENFFKGFKLL